jgi:hypothetical protein
VWNVRLWRIDGPFARYKNAGHVEMNVLYVVLSDLTELSVKRERYSTSNKGNGHCVAMPMAFDARRRAMPGTDPNREGATVQQGRTKGLVAVMKVLCGCNPTSPSS